VNCDVLEINGGDIREVEVLEVKGVDVSVLEISVASKLDVLENVTLHINAN
jgi:hypothetical protein